MGVGEGLVMLSGLQCVSTVSIFPNTTQSCLHRHDFIIWEICQQFWSTSSRAKAMYIFICPTKSVINFRKYDPFYFSSAMDEAMDPGCLLYPALHSACDGGECQLSDSVFSFCGNQKERSN